MPPGPTKYYRNTSKRVGVMEPTKSALNFHQREITNEKCFLYTCNLKGHRDNGARKNIFTVTREADFYIHLSFLFLDSLHSKTDVYYTKSKTGECLMFSNGVVQYLRFSLVFWFRNQIWTTGKFGIRIKFHNRTFSLNIMNRIVKRP